MAQRRRLTFFQAVPSVLAKHASPTGGTASSHSTIRALSRRSRRTCRLVRRDSRLGRATCPTPWPPRSRGAHRPRRCFCTTQGRTSPRRAKRERRRCGRRPTGPGTCLPRRACTRPNQRAPRARPPSRWARKRIGRLRDLAESSAGRERRSWSRGE
eukprot:scaffold68494_cov31-Tisochrysis_lutea.AAC.1